MKKNEAGQSMIEFIFTFAFTVAIIFLFAAQGYNLVTGYLVHYATYMSSRSYLTADSMGSNIQDPSQQSAKDTYARYKLDLLDIPGEPQFKSFTQARSQSANGLYVGTTVQYEKPFSYINLIGGGTTVKYLSESFLGKEPSRMSCWNRTCFAITGSDGLCDGGSSANQLNITVDDNGC